MSKSQCRRGFTLVELLVVIGIIALLVSMLLPALARARWHAKLIECASNERQYVMAMIQYANESDGFLPRFDEPNGVTGANNPHDISFSLRDSLKGYGLVDRLFFCSLTDDSIIDNLGNDGSFMQQGYELWVPRQSGVMFPPDPGGGYPVNGTGLIRGPIKFGDTVANINPVLTDDIYLDPSVAANAPGYSVANAPPTDFYQVDCDHMYFGKLDATNQAYIDGHVERVPPGDIVWRYLSGNAWVCR